MQFLMMVKASENTAAPPPQAMFDAMDEYVAKQIASGAVINTGGLRRTSEAVRVSIRNAKIIVTDGPFTEAKEVVGGYAIVNADSREHALEMAKEFMQLHIDTWPDFEGTSEIRQIDAMFTP